MNLQYFAEEPEAVEEVTKPVDIVEDVEVIEDIDAIDMNDVRSAMGLKPKEAKEVEAVAEDLPKDETDEVIEVKPDIPDYVVKFLEEFEGTVNGEKVKPKDLEDLRARFQMGMNYDKKSGQADEYKSKADEYETKVKEFEKLLGMDFNTALERTRANKTQDEIAEYSEAHNVTEEEAKELIEKNKRIKELEFKNQTRDHKDQALVKKKELANELYFKELEPEIDELIQENLDKGQLIDVDTAYKYLLGTRAKELLADSKKETEKRTLANVQDRAKRTVEKEVGAENQTVVLSNEAKLMAKEMGVSLKSLAKRLAKKRRSD